jgi:hypothetical protein
MTSLQRPVGSGFGITSTASDVIDGIDLAGKVGLVPRTLVLPRRFRRPKFRASRLRSLVGLRIIEDRKHSLRGRVRPSRSAGKSPCVSLHPSGIAHANTNGQTIRLSTALLQPIAPQDAARAVSDAALADPVNGIVGVAGPDKIGLDDLVRRFLKKTNAPREVVSDPKAHYFGVEINDRSLTPGEGVHIAATHFDEWLKTSAKK